MNSCSTTLTLYAFSIICAFTFLLDVLQFNIQSTRKCITIYNNFQEYTQLFSSPYDYLTFQRLSITLFLLFLCYKTCFDNGDSIEVIYIR